jgi:hypothetical protein
MRKKKEVKKKIWKRVKKKKESIKHEEEVMLNGRRNWQ